MQDPGDDHPHDREAERDQRVEHDEHTARGRDALPALALEREHVAEHRGDAEHERARPGPRRRADAGRDRALREVDQEHEEPGPPAEQPGDVRRARVARALAA